MSTELFPVAPMLDSGATISECGKYRYRLWRVWDESLPTCCFVMLNPSKADATEDDPTIRQEREQDATMRNPCQDEGD